MPCRTSRTTRLNVHFQTEGATRSAAGGTADLLVGGEAGTGANGIPFDVYTPITTKPNGVFRAMAEKTDQTPNLIVNLKHTTVKSSDLGDISKRLQGMGKQPFKHIIFIQ